MQYLTVDEVIAIHWQVIEHFGGAHGILNQRQLDSCVETPKQTMFGDELYPDLAAKAGILFFLLVKNHCFVDGNKRTAVLALLECLERNGYAVRVSNNELYHLTMSVATSKLDKDQVTEWIRQRIEPLQGQV